MIKTIWFELHVILSFLSYGLFGIGFILGILYFKDNKDSSGYDLERIDLNINQEGYITDWTINLIKYPQSRVEFSIKPNKPFFTNGIGVYVCSGLPFQGSPYRDQQRTRCIMGTYRSDPFCLRHCYTVTLMVLKLRKERQRREDNS